MKTKKELLRDRNFDPFAQIIRDEEGHVANVSNFRHPVSPLIEPMVAHCLESPPRELLTRAITGIQSGHVSNSPRVPR